MVDVIIILSTLFVIAVGFAGVIDAVNSWIDHWKETGKWW